MRATAFVAGCAIISAILWDAFEALVLPRTPMHRVRLTRLYYHTTWKWWVVYALKHRSDRRREHFLAVFGPLSVIGLLALWAAGLVTGFALLQWSQRALLVNLAGDPHFFDELYMSATTLFSLGPGDLIPKVEAGACWSSLRPVRASCCSRWSSPTFPFCISRSAAGRCV